MDLVSSDLMVVDVQPVFIFHAIKGLDPRTLLNQRVNIDGHTYKVVRVETHCVVDATGHQFALMVTRI